MWWASVFIGPHVFILYLDEFGHAGPWDPANPRYNHHPLFGLAGFAVAGGKWHGIDRGYLRKKRSFYASEVQRAQQLDGLRPERYEPKRLRSRRDKRFARSILSLLNSADAKIFAYGCAKRTGVNVFDNNSLYTTTVQGLLSQFEKFLKNAAGRRHGRGVIVMDRRNERLNEIVLASSQSYLFSQAFERIVETPLLVPSEWYHGVQMADTIGRVISALQRYRHLNDQSWQWAETEFGSTVDQLTAVIGHWKSVYMR